MTPSNESADRLRRLQAQKEASGVDLVAIGPTPNMRYLIVFMPFALKRLCVLLVTHKATRLIAGMLNAVELEAHATGMDT
jgi:hypothetical protein